MSIDDEMPKPNKPKSPKPHYCGHRARLKQRFKDAGAIAFADYELLELLLFFAIPRGDTKPIAKALIKKFGRLQALVEADEKLMQEVDGVGPTTCHLLKLHQALLQRQLKNTVIDKPTPNWRPNPI